MAVAKNILRLENINYRFISFVNVTIDTDAAITDELGARRLTSIQTDSNSCCATCIVPIFRSMLTGMISQYAQISIKHTALQELPLLL